MSIKTCVLPTVLTFFLLLAQTAEADFTFSNEFGLGSSGDHHGIAFDGVNWHIADPFDNTFHNYDSNFNFLGVPR